MIPLKLRPVLWFFLTVPAICMCFVTKVISASCHFLQIYCSIRYSSIGTLFEKADKILAFLNLKSETRLETSCIFLARPTSNFKQRT